VRALVSSANGEVGGPGGATCPRSTSRGFGACSSSDLPRGEMRSIDVELDHRVVVDARDAAPLAPHHELRVAARRRFEVQPDRVDEVARLFVRGARQTVRDGMPLPLRLQSFTATDGEFVPAWLTDRDRPWLRDLLEEAEAATGRPVAELARRWRRSDPDPRAGPPSCSRARGPARSCAAEQAGPARPPTLRRVSPARASARRTSWSPRGSCRSGDGSIPPTCWPCCNGSASLPLRGEPADPFACGGPTR
jgi:hypothetical protein